MTESCEVGCARSRSIQSEPTDLVGTRGADRLGQRRVARGTRTSIDTCGIRPTLTCVVGSPGRLTRSPGPGDGPMSPIT
jgi:hypothetical protein